MSLLASAGFKRRSNLAVTSTRFALSSRGQPLTGRPSIKFEREFVVDLLRTAGQFNVSSTSSVFGLTNHLINEEVVLISSLPESELAPLMVEVEVDAFVPKANLRSELAAVIRSVAARA